MDQVQVGTQRVPEGLPAAIGLGSHRGIRQEEAGGREGQGDGQRNGPGQRPAAQGEQDADRSRQQQPGQGECRLLGQVRFG